jgi:hypothetical protein
MRPGAPLLVLLLLAAPAASLPTAADPLARAEALWDSNTWAGHTPRGWLGWAHDRLAGAPAPLAEADLAAATLALYAAAGADPTGAEVEALHRDASALGPGGSVLGGLVAVLAEAYAAQAVIAAHVDPAARPMLPLAATEAGAANAARVLGALDAVRVQAHALPPQGFRDPLGLVVLGSPGDDVHLRAPGRFPDPVLLLDPAGNDLDRTSAGAACPAPPNDIATCNGLALAVRADFAGDDTYDFEAPHGVAHGSGALGGLGILLDHDGHDTYVARQRVAHGPFVTYYINGVMQGSGEGGLGLLVDRAGDDHYLFQGHSSTRELFGQGQGFAGLGGLGALLDGAGRDTYEGLGDCDGARGQFCGLYVQATALYPGVALQLDAGSGDDVYRGILVAPQEDYYSQAFAAFGAFALQVDEGGDDDYLARAVSTNPSGGVSLNCAFGTAEYGGALAIFVDRDGNDRYLTETISPNPPLTMAEGFSLAAASLFWDVRGDDWHEMRAIGPSPVIVGRGTGSSALENSAFYLDSGGRDTYADPVGRDQGAWGPPGSLGLGVDVNLL